MGGELIATAEGAQDSALDLALVAEALDDVDVLIDALSALGAADGDVQVVATLAVRAVHVKRAQKLCLRFWERNMRTSCQFRVQPGSPRGPNQPFCANFLITTS